MLESMRGRAKMLIAGTLLACGLALAGCGGDASLTVIRTPTGGAAPTPTATPQEG